MKVGGIVYSSGSCRSEKEAPRYSSVKPLNHDQAHKLLVELAEESEEDTILTWRMRFK